MAATPIERNAVAVAATPSAATLDFEIFLPVRNVTDLQRLIEAQQNGSSASYHKWLTPAQYAATYGPTPATVTSVTSAVNAAGLKVTAQHARSLHVSGSAAQVASFLKTSFKTVNTAEGATRIVAATPVVMPSALSAAGAKIVSFSGLPTRRASVRKVSATPLADTSNRYGPDGPYWYNDMKQAYDYPSYQSFLPGGARLDGTGVRVAILMGDDVLDSDVDAFFTHEHFTLTTGKPNPTIHHAYVNGGGAIFGPDAFEATLDVQQVLGGAPGSTVTLVSIPNLSDDNILDGYTYIVNQNTFDLVNASFGGCELVYTAAYNGGTDFTYILQILHEEFQQGSAQGITFFASSGDSGGLSCPSVDYFYGGAHPTFVVAIENPADDPNVTAVGGGNLVTSVGTPAPLSAVYVSENGFGDPEIPYDIYGIGTNVSGGYWGAGGGKSVIFARPAYQSNINTGSTTMRTVPDVGMMVGGCPGGISVDPCGPDRSAAVTAYGVGFGGGLYGVIGTSVSSPEFVGATALYLQKVGNRQGNFNYYLYHYGLAQTLSGGVSAPSAAQFYHRNIDGFDGAWDANTPSKNYNYINGNGTPDVRKLFGMTAFPAAGTPQSASNP
jgi:subtilase family serine protease